MRSFAARRSLNLTLLVAASFLVAAVNGVLLISRHSASYCSGWLLLLMIAGLALYGLRKKLPLLPLGSSSMWLQLHIHGGLLSLVVFALHVEFRVPGGVFESILATVYLSVFSSGVIGLLVSRGFARRLTAREPQLALDQIARRRSQLAEEVESIVSRCQEAGEASAVRDFHETRLRAYFDAPRNFVQHVLASNRPRRTLLADMKSYGRYLGQAELAAMKEIAGRVKAKDDLDHQRALQFVLKHWLFTHVPLTYSLLLLSLFHVVLVHAFSGRG